MEFLNIFSSIGTPALILLVLVILFFMIKEIKADNARMAQSFKDSQAETKAEIDRFKQEMVASLEEQRKQQEKRDARQDEALEQLTTRMLTVERDYAKKIDIQEAVGGWRTELKTLGDRIDMYFLGGKNNGRD